MLQPFTRLGSSGRPEDLGELVRRRDLELIVAAVLRRLVEPPSLKDRRVAEAIALHVIVLHFADPLDPQRFPRQVLARAPPALSTRHACRLRGSRDCPFAPRVILERARAQRLEILRQLPPRRHVEGGRHANMMQTATVVVQTQQQRSDERVAPVLVPAETGDDAVGGADVFDLSIARLPGS
jgi:hypothetical protein